MAEAREGRSGEASQGTAPQSTRPRAKPGGPGATHLRHRRPHWGYHGVRPVLGVSVWAETLPRGLAAGLG